MTDELLEQILILLKDFAETIRDFEEDIMILTKIILLNSSKTILT